ncbi:MAG: MiaB/RimO family radical SAM methylthiotransferase [Elusimicrobia bacterium]|nr:MiaB/RimO family radical SAM methylthiotransferase [Elusimicrobiota bacterium]
MDIWVKTFGCRVNQAEGDALKAALLAGGAASATGFEDADVCVVNTCTVTAEADREALALLRRVTRRNPAARLVVTGCLAERAPDLVRAAAPHATVVGHAGKASIPALFGCAPAPAEAALPASNGRSRAFLKIQDGCNMACAYCTIPSIRPTLVSLPVAELLEKTRAYAAAGVPEIVLCGVRLGRYLRRDAGTRTDLAGLIERLLEVPGNFRVRLSSLEVTDATDRLFTLMRGAGGRLCPHLHLPLQSGCDATLKRMKRWYTADFYRRRADAYRAAAPDGSLFADVIAGFPEETDAEHEESLGFARDLQFDGLHVFRYSPRPGTAAARWKAPSERVVSARAQAWRTLDFERRGAHARRAVGRPRVLAPALDGREGVSEDFLTVRVDGVLGRGLTPVRVTGLAGGVPTGTARTAV